MERKRGEILHQILTQIVLIAVIFGLFFFASADKINNRGVKQQVLEKELALILDSAVPGMQVEVKKQNMNGNVNKIDIRDGRIYVTIAGLPSIKGYPFLSKYIVSVEEKETKFIIAVR